MPCQNFLNGQPGTNARFRVTKDNDETLWGQLSDFDRASESLTPTTYSKKELRDGISFPMVAGHSYHFLIVKIPTAGQITVQVNVPQNEQTTCSAADRFIGPWVVRA